MEDAGSAPGGERNRDLKVLQARLGAVFPKNDLLNEALTHRSYAKERDLDFDNERLEFLGDAVLELVISEYLFLNFPSALEGDLARLRAAVVSEHSLANKARELDLGEYLLLGHGEEHTGGRRLDSLLANGLEAVIGALYLEMGYFQVRAFILGLFEDDVEDLWESKDFIDPKSALQERIQQFSTQTPIYKVYDEQGPQHDKTFFVVVRWQGKNLGKGRGKTKKEAEQAAAKNALSKFAGKKNLIKDKASG
ncbi:MAG: ribonuclease III [Firmicutes bacterium]|nr:ribonuclease III [Bacillota bacterium]